MTENIYTTPIVNKLQEVLDALHAVNWALRHPRECKEQEYKERTKSRGGYETETRLPAHQDGKLSDVRPTPVHDMNLVVTDMSGAKPIIKCQGGTALNNEYLQKLRDIDAVIRRTT